MQVSIKNHFFKFYISIYISGTDFKLNMFDRTEVRKRFCSESLDQALISISSISDGGTE